MSAWKCVINNECLEKLLCNEFHCIYILLHIISSIEILFFSLPSNFFRIGRYYVFHFYSGFKIMVVLNNMILGNLFSFGCHYVWVLLLLQTNKIIHKYHIFNVLINIIFEF